MSIIRILLACSALGAAVFCGCGSRPPDQLTREQIEKQRAEDKVDLEAEDKAEAEFQRQLRQRGS